MHKGGHHLLAAWSKLGARAGGELVLAGDRALPAGFSARLPAGVHVVGRIPQSELFALFRRSDVLVLPSLSDGFGMVVTEALAHGLPVIATHNVGASDLLREGINGWVVAPGDVEGLAARLAWCMDHRSELREMRPAAEQTAAAHPWSEYRRRLVRTVLDYFGTSDRLTRMARKRICIVSSGSLSSGPRVEKEADALADAGHDVHVLVCHTLPWMIDWDARLAAGRPWTLDALESGRTPGARVRHAGHRALCEVSKRLAVRVGPRFPLAEVGLSERVAPLWWRGRGVRADLFIAHNLPALPVAAALARRNRARLAFDAEDDHLGEVSEAQRSSLEATLIHAVLARYLGRCDRVTAASAGIADALVNRYGIARPAIVHNDFRSPHATTSTVVASTEAAAGFDLLVLAVARARSRTARTSHRPRICCAASSKCTCAAMHRAGQNELLRIAGSNGYAGASISSSSPPERVAQPYRGTRHRPRARATRERQQAEHRLQQALLLHDRRARDRGNRYAGQRSVLGDLPEAGFMYSPGDATALAAGLQRWIDHPDQLARARARASEAARTWCWERERETLVAGYASVLARPLRPVT